ncbi:MAG: hypothetical protein A2W91_13890 [Bacteroidetes bacterium GWF2_38_335]|nr:MAG: hypothetical protein A2W91_13890 [Bacteroidetes bacterium GWF2_38_335]OFY77807.1 MAG: hypothetical protein A2281_15580 [Bacteroidetes bacterium RIFOXYA12_FULL_38_20]HBS87387.1 hypothetical protein [Bacteroidales bacterium]
MNKFILLFTILAISFLNIDAQKVNKKKEFKEATRLIGLKDYKSAQKHANRLYLLEKSNANFNYLLGLCLLNSDLEKPQSIQHLERASASVTKDYIFEDPSEKKAPVISVYYLGMAYHYNNEFDKAIETANKYKSLVSDEAEKQNADQIISYCQNAKNFIKDPIDITIENLKGINSEYDEHTPIIAGNEDLMIFTSRRPGSTGNLIADDGKYFEDIYFSRFENGSWSAPQKISKNINTDAHDASVCISPDGQELFIFRDEDGVGNLFHSFYDSTDWTIPKRLESNINTQFRETHASFTSNTLYFTSDRKEGSGGKDLYVVKRLPTGEWSLAQNMGETINTPFDEEGPFIHPDGQTLYFSSKGHNSMGGYDLFFCQLQPDGTWSKPQNLGYPINTTGDDVFYVLSNDGKRAYYSSIKKEGLGGRDLYMMNLLSLPERSTVVIKGVVRMAGSADIPKDITITVTEVKTGVLIGKYRPNSSTGKYTIILRNGREYKLACEADNCKFKEEILKVPDDASYFELSKPIYMDPLGIIEK